MSGNQTAVDDPGPALDPDAAATQGAPHRGRARLVGTALVSLLVGVLATVWVVQARSSSYGAAAMIDSALVMAGPPDSVG